MPWTRELAQFPTPTIAILIFLIAKLLKLKGYLIFEARHKLGRFPGRLPPAVSHENLYKCKRGMCQKSRRLARTDIRGKVRGIPGPREALPRRYNKCA